MVNFLRAGNAKNFVFDKSNEVGSRFRKECEYYMHTLLPELKGLLFQVFEFFLLTAI